jgi:acetoin utilization deacetylase AcuC-like enzyme
MATAYITHPDYRQHNLDGHPENASRIEHVWQVFEESGVVERLLPITPNRAALEQLALVHDAGHIIRVKETCARGGGMLDPDTYARQSSYDIARLSAGGAVAAVDAILSGQARNALVVTRPPGHHATPTRAMGFCLFNNVAIAARHAVTAYPEINRVMIVDYDVHHGNGTQEAFYSDQAVLYVSSHQYPFYPGTGALRDTGAGDGAGTTLNMPLRAGTGNDGFARLYQQVVWPAARRFHPDLILVSAGFDAHWADPLAMLQLDLRGYAHLTRELIAMAQEYCAGRIAFIMEGGYDTEVLAHGLLNVAYALLDVDEIIDPVGEIDMPGQDTAELADQLTRIHNLT